MPSKHGDLQGVGLGVDREVAQLHILDHTLTEGCHRSAPVDFSILWPKFQQSMAIGAQKTVVGSLGLGI